MSELSQNKVKCLDWLPTFFFSKSKAAEFSVQAQLLLEHTGSFFPGILGLSTYRLRTSLRIPVHREGSNLLNIVHVPSQSLMSASSVLSEFTDWASRGKPQASCFCIFCCGEILTYPHVSSLIAAAV